MTFAEIQRLEAARNAGFDTIFHLVGSSEDNANDTVYLEKTVAEIEWNKVALASLELNLSCCKDEVALEWFRSIGFDW